MPKPADTVESIERIAGKKPGIVKRVKGFKATD